MPQPYPGPMIGNADVLAGRPRIAVAMAEISSCWALVEHEMLILLGCATGEMMGSSTPGMTAVYMNPVARAAMNVTVSLHTRLQLLDEALRDILDDQHRRRWESLKRDIRSRAKQRNRVVHAMVYAPSEGDDLLEKIVLESPTYPEPFVYSLAELSEIAERIKVTVETTKALSRDLVKAQAQLSLPQGQDHLQPDYWDCEDIDD